MRWGGGEFLACKRRNIVGSNNELFVVCLASSLRGNSIMIDSASSIASFINYEDHRDAQQVVVRVLAEH